MEKRKNYKFHNSNNEMEENVGKLYNSMHEIKEDVNKLYNPSHETEENINQVEESIHEVGGDATKYGEFVSSYFAWIPLNRQKEKAEDMQNMTNVNRRKNKN